MKEVNDMNVLVLIAHPQLNHSRVNRRWKQELESVPDVTIHDLYAQYPDEHIDVKRNSRFCIPMTGSSFSSRFTGTARRLF